MNVTAQKPRAILTIKANCEDIQRISRVSMGFVSFGAPSELHQSWPIESR